MAFVEGTVMAVDMPLGVTITLAIFIAAASFDNLHTTVDRVYRLHETRNLRNQLLT
jgi:hypothetical protein